MAPLEKEQLLEQQPNQHEVDEDEVLERQLNHRQQKGEAERTVVLRVYNYFRIVLSFFLLILFLTPFCKLVFEL